MAALNARDLKTTAKTKLKGHTGTYILAVIIMGVITGITSQLAGLSILLTGAFSLAFVMMDLKLLSDQGIEVGDVFEGFKNFVPSLFLMLKQSLFLVLWTLLFIPVGIVKSFSYTMSYYILAENPDMTAGEAITKSREMMNGHKMDLFFVYLSFIGWFFLCILTFGLAFFYVGPYMQVTKGAFYNEIKNK